MEPRNLHMGCVISACDHCGHWSRLFRALWAATARCRLLCPSCYENNERQQIGARRRWFFNGDRVNGS